MQIVRFISRELLHFSNENRVNLYTCSSFLSKVIWKMCVFPVQLVQSATSLDGLFVTVYPHCLNLYNIFLSRYKPRTIILIPTNTCSANLSENVFFFFFLRIQTFSCKKKSHNLSLFGAKGLITKEYKNYFNTFKILTSIYLYLTV